MATVSSQRIAGVIILLIGSILLIIDLGAVSSYWGSIPPQGFYIFMMYYFGFIMCIDGLIMSGGLALANDSKWGSGMALLGGIIATTIGCITACGIIIGSLSGGGYLLKDAWELIISCVIQFTLLGATIFIAASIGKRVE